MRERFVTMTRTLVLLFLLVSLVLPIFSYADDAASTEKQAASQAATSYEEPKLNLLSWLTNIPGDWVAASKTIFSKESITPFLWVVGSTAVLMNQDYELYIPLKKAYQRDKTFYDASNFGWEVGKGGSEIALGGGFLLSGIIWKNHKAVRTASQIAEVVLATGVTTQVLKHMTGRESPSVAISPKTGMWRFFLSPKTYSHRVSAHDAYPSGHLATTIATANVIMNNYPDQKWIPYVAYPVIGFVAVSMVSTGGHWWSDYPLSIFLGYHMAKAVTRHNPEMQSKAEMKQGQFDIAPVKNGLAMTYTKLIF